MNIQLKGTKEEIAEAIEVRKGILPMVEKAIDVVEQSSHSERANQKFLDINKRALRLLKALDKVADARFWVENFSGLNRYMAQTEGALENAKTANDTDAIALFTGYLDRMPKDLAQRMWDKARQEPDEVEELIRKASTR